MKLFLLICSFSFIASLEGKILVDRWKEGAAEVGQLDLEPNLSGGALLDSLIADIGTYIDGIENTLSGQVTEGAGKYANRAYYASVDLNNAVSRVNATSPPDLFDAMMLSFSSFLSDFVQDFKGLGNGTKAKVSTSSFPKMGFRRTRQQVTPPGHSMDDLVSHLDYTIDADLAKLSEYIEEMLYMGKNKVSLYYADIVADFRSKLAGAFSMVEGFLKNTDGYSAKLEAHTSKAVLFNFDTLKAEALKLIAN